MEERIKEDIVDLVTITDINEGFVKKSEDDLKRLLGNLKDLN